MKLSELYLYNVAISDQQSTGDNKLATITINKTDYDLYYNNTTYSAGTGLSLSGTSFSLSSSGVTSGTYGPTSNATITNGGTFSVPSYTVDTYGRITSSYTRTLTLPTVSSGSTVSVTRSQTSGTKTATITVDGTSYDIYYTNTTYYTATQSSNGLMSYIDKNKLDIATTTIRIYLSTSGSDSNSGLTSSAPIRTFLKLKQILDSITGTTSYCIDNYNSHPGLVRPVKCVEVIFLTGGFLSV